MKHIKLLSLTSLLPIAVVPAITTSCNKTVEDHILVLHEVIAGKFIYVPPLCMEQESYKVKYLKGEHTFTINSVQEGYPVFNFVIQTDDQPEQLIDIGNWKVVLNGQDISDHWQYANNNMIMVNEPTEAIFKGTVSFTVTLLKDIECAPACILD